MSKSSIYNSYVDADFDPIPKTSASSSALPLQQQQQSSSHGATRQRSSQAERLKQLQDLGQHIEEATTWSRRRAELVTTTANNTIASSASSSRFRQTLESKKPTSNDMERLDSTTIDDQDSSSSSSVDLREASLEDLEVLIAASAQRLANYQMKRRSERHSMISTTDDTTTTSTATKSTTKHNRQDEEAEFDLTSPASVTSSYNSLHKDTNTTNSLSPPMGSSTNHSPPIPSLSNNISSSKRISAKKYLHRTLPASLSSHHQLVDKEKFSLVSPTSPSLSFRRSYQMTPPPAPSISATSPKRRPSKINTLQQASSSSSSPSNNESHKRQQQHYSVSSSSPSSSSLPPSPIHNTVSSSKIISSSRLSSSISSGGLSKMALMMDPASSSASSSSSSSSPSSSPSSHLRKSLSPQQQQKQQRSSITSSTITTSSGTRRVRTISTLGQSPLESSTAVSTDKRPPVTRQRTRSVVKDGMDESTTSSSSSSNRKSLDATSSPRHQRTRHVSLLTKPSTLTTNTSPSLSRSRKTSMVALSSSRKEEPAVESKPLRSRVVSQTSSPGKPTSRHRVSSTTSRPARDQPFTATSTTAATTTTATPKTAAASSHQVASKGNETKGRKRGKTLPGSLATRPAMSLALPPIKVEPISSDSSHSNLMRSTAKTPTRIPLLMKSSKSQIADEDDDDDDEDDNGDDDDFGPDANDVVGDSSEEQRSINETKTAKVGASSMIYSTNHNNSASYIAPPGMMLPGSKSSRDPILRKQHSTVTMRTSTSQVTTGTTSSNNGTTSNHSKNTKSSTSLLLDSGTMRTRKISTISTRTGLGVSASVKPSEKSSDPRRNRVPTLHERLQALVNESNSWRNNSTSQHTSSTSASSSTTTANLQQKSTSVLANKKEIVIRGGGHSTKTNADELNSEVLFQGGQPLTPAQGLKKGGAYLTDFEKFEMQQYPAIYFMGQPDCKRRRGRQQEDSSSSSSNKKEWNDGYDDDRGDYHIVLRDHLAYRYEVLGILGKGSFGQVLKCFDHHDGHTVAIKLIRNKKRFHTQAVVEINILKQLVAWDPDDEHHNVRMRDHFSFRNHLCLVFECLSINLYDFIKSNHFQGFSMGLIKRFTVQILQSLSLLHKHKLIHCDLKPENILLKSPNKSAIKVIDFGSSCLENEKVYTYIQSRFYRSPEVILGMNYGMAIDMWSVGCILAELYSGYPLFPGENEQEQLACIMEIMDVPHIALVEKSSRRKLFFDALGQPRIVANSKGKKRYPRTKTLEQALGRKHQHNTATNKMTEGTFALFVDFLQQCLQWDPARRITPDQAFHHPWIRAATSVSKKRLPSSTSSSSSSLPL